MVLNRKIKGITETWGADFVGVADLSLAHDAMLEQGGPVIAAYPRAISVGIGLLHNIVDQLPNRANRAVALSYQYHSYDLINQRLDLLISQLSRFLHRQELPAGDARNGSAGALGHGSHRCSFKDNGEAGKGSLRQL